MSDNVLSVEGRHESKEASGGNSAATVRQFSRKWTLPPDCRLANQRPIVCHNHYLQYSLLILFRSDEVTSNLSSDGVLMVSAPRQAGPAVKHDSTKAIQ